MPFHLKPWDDPTTAGRGRKANRKYQAILELDEELRQPWDSLRAQLFPEGLQVRDMPRSPGAKTPKRGRRVRVVAVAREPKGGRP